MRDWWGNTAPQNMDNRYANKYSSFRDHWNYDNVSEDGLRINIYTPTINDGQRRSVMFWIHGGGYTNGKGLPPWPKYTSAKGETMVLDDVCEVKNDPDREARKALPSIG
jgi:carboxylesterase type B